jgi:hypothetical protein
MQAIQLPEQVTSVYERHGERRRIYADGRDVFLVILCRLAIRIPLTERSARLTVAPRHGAAAAIAGR